MRISLIAAMSKNRAIGKNNKLPWNIPEDLKYFRDKTRGKTVVMGRKTYDSIGRLLPKRTNVIITRKLNYDVDGAIIVNNIDSLFDNIKDDDEVMIIGGSEIYNQMLPLAERIYLTIINTEIDGDSFFPQLDDNWVEVSSDQRSGSPSFSFNIYERKKWIFGEYLVEQIK